ncbi:MAG: iron ABC transporter permease [Desulfobacterales bacterium]
MTISALLCLFLLAVMILGLSAGSAGTGLKEGLKAVFSVFIEDSSNDSMMQTIIWQIRFPRVLLAALVGAALSLGGLVFQALLRNPLAEPYILGISGGAAIGAISGILMGFSRFPGVSLTAFAGSMGTLALVLMMASGQTVLKKDSLLLSGVMVNAFCSAVIMFLISLTQDARIHNIMFWLMGDFSLVEMQQVYIVAATVLPCFLLIFCLSNAMNLMLMGKDMARSMGINIKAVTITLLITTSFMISATVAQCGLIGFVGLVMPHLLRILLGPDHRLMVPSCIIGGAGYMVACDILARTLPEHGEIPAGVITAMIGAPLFIFLLKRSKS